MANELLDQAIKYAEKGWKVFPCRESIGKSYIDRSGKEKIPREKTPYTHDGFKSATTDISQIQKWWTEFPNACIGVSCGESNLFVIDIDTKHGKDGMNNYMKLGLDDSGALHSLTPSGGLHLVFKGLGRSTTDIMNGVDTRGTGGYFIAPPSRIINGEINGKYLALDDWNREPDDIPSDLLQRLNVAKSRRKITASISDHKEESHEEVVQKAEIALSKLPERMANSYQEWISVGLSLYSLGLDGLILWDRWSKNSYKYEPGACEEKWQTFNAVEEITLGSLFFWAKYNEE